MISHQCFSDIQFKLHLGTEDVSENYFPGCYMIVSFQNNTSLFILINELSRIVQF